MFNSILHNIFTGYRESEVTMRKQHEWKFQELNDYPMLFSSTYLYELTNEAETIEEYEQIIAYLSRYSKHTSGIDSYDKLRKMTYKQLNKQRRKQDADDSI